MLFFSALLLATPIVYKFETRESLLYLGVILPQMPDATKESLLLLEALFAFKILLYPKFQIKRSKEHTKVLERVCCC